MYRVVESMTRRLGARGYRRQLILDLLYHKQVQHLLTLYLLSSGRCHLFIRGIYQEVQDLLKEMWSVLMKVAKRRFRRSDVTHVTSSNLNLTPIAPFSFLCLSSATTVL